jgi:hypothetical protein
MNQEFCYMNCQSLSRAKALDFFAFAARRRHLFLAFLLAALSLGASAQSWSSFIDPSRAIDWTGAGFTIPSYSTNCSVQPTFVSPDSAMNITSVSDSYSSDGWHTITMTVSGTPTANMTVGEYVGVAGVTASSGLSSGGYNGNFQITSVSGSTIVYKKYDNANYQNYSSGGAAGTATAIRAAANTTSVQNALNSCDATHNVVNLPAGTNYLAGVTFGTQGKQVLRGAGPNATNIISVGQPGAGQAGCAGEWAAFCMISFDPNFGGSYDALPPSGMRQCQWTGTNGVVGTYTKGATSLILNNCPGGGPPVNQTLILDQADDMTDNGGVAICGSEMTGCTLEAGDPHGRTINGIVHNHSQVVYVTGVSGSGTGPYTVTIAQGIYANNIRSGMDAGAWWPGFVQNEGLENLSVTAPVSLSSGYTTTMFNCYQCWVRNVRFINGPRANVLVYQSAQDVIRDNYMYGAQGDGSQSYSIEFEIASGVLVENNIFQQSTAQIMFGTGTGNVIGYNFGVNSVFSGTGQFPQTSYSGHSPGGQMNLFEGNNLLGIWTDDVHGTTATTTFYRNLLQGYQKNKPGIPGIIALRGRHRAYNIIGNVLGQPGYDTVYEAYATSTTTTTSNLNSNVNIYEFGTVDNGGIACGPTVMCDTLVRSTTARWGNWDVVNNSTKWDSTEAAPGAVAYANANFSTSYFNSLAHNLPASLYYNSTPSWWPSGKAWPSVGPDVTTGNLGICTGATYTGAQATSASQCIGGTLTAGWASHATSIPAQDCYLSLGGPPDGSGNALAFDANACYPKSGTSGTGIGNPTGLTATVM